MSENEATVCEIYLGDYIMTRLCHQFIVEAGAPFLSFIDFFERREVTAHLLFPKTLMLVNQHLNLFLKFGNSRESLKAKDLLKFDYKKPELLMTKKELFIGGKAREFIKKMGLTCDSPELAEFFEGVVRYVRVFLCDEFLKWLFTGTIMIALELFSSTARRHSPVLSSLI